MDKKKEVNIQALTAMGMQVVYRQIDVTDRLAVKHFVEDILKVYGQLHGVIHSAGIIRDNFIIKKSPSQFLEVMAPKTHGLVNLDLACQDCPLDFFIIFSSLAGGMGNVGQSDYAGASAFMDAYAHYRQRLVEEKKRQGRTISFNWPLWQDGGMHLDSETEDMMRKSTGMVAMETTRGGMKAFYEGLTLPPYSQIMVMAGERSRFQEMLSRLPIQKAPQVDDMSVINLTPDQDSMTEKATDYIKSFLSAGLKLPTEQIESDADFMTYGMDSVVVLKLTQQ
ncbi:beta-ketoacyl reductase, partial [Gracilibacillus sp. JCM 18860]|uniref:beta-ketoacyl reductase n=1 Tax=Gracilibacillus sp. JCM 18860 TaxID=1306159 RepID=UPI000A4CB6CA